MQWRVSGGRKRPHPDCGTGFYEIPAAGSPVAIRKAPLRNGDPLDHRPKSGCARRKMYLALPPACVSVSSFWLPDEAKIETEQEEDEMDYGAATADLRCLDKTCPQQRHRNIGEIEIEQNAR